ncbi:MAG TPA: SCO family protein [Gemmatimonadales bacterium]
MTPGKLARRGAALVAAVLLLGACGDDPATFRGVALDPPEPAPALRLANAAGDTFDLAAERGRAVLLFFGYTRCPDVCPTTLADWARVRNELGDAADDVRFVFVSVDPERDTPAVAQEYASRFDSSFVGLSAERASLPALLAAWRIAAYEEPAPLPDSVAAADTLPPGMIGEDYFVAHSSQTFLVDPEGRLRALYPVGTTAQDLVEDLRRVLD